MHWNTQDNIGIVIREGEKSVRRNILQIDAISSLVEGLLAIDNPIGACGTVQRQTEREIPTFPSFKERGDTMENRRCHRSFMDNQCNRISSKPGRKLWPGLHSFQATEQVHQTVDLQNGDYDD